MKDNVWGESVLGESWARENVCGVRERVRKVIVGKREFIWVREG